MNYRLGPAMWMLTFTGARRSEVAGAQWRDLDLEAGEWSVRRSQLVTGPGEPKSKAGRRIIGLDDRTIGMLREWKIRQRDELIASGVNPLQHRELPVFAAPGATKALYPDTISRLHVRIRKAADLPPMKMHGLRHLHGSFLVSAGESLKAVSTRLGHSSAAFTLMTYIRDLPQERQQLASRFSDIIEDAANQ
jgi:integrase